MENEILQQILNKLKGIKTDVSELKTDVTELKQGQARLEQGQSRLKVILETETNLKINLLVEGHKGVVEKLKKLDVLDEKVDSLTDNTIVHKAAIKELARKTSNM